MASIDKIKGRYLFGGSEAASIVPQAGVGNLTYLPGPGGAVWHPNYVDLRQGSRFRTPFNSTPRNRTIIVAGTFGFYEMGYDGSANRFPPVTNPAMELARSNLMMSWQTDGYVATAGADMLVSLDGGSASTNVTGVSNTAISYRDGTFNWTPGLVVLGQGADGTGTYNGATKGRNMDWETNNTPYLGSGSPGVPTNFGHTSYNAAAATGFASDHMMLLGFAEYSYLNKAEALEACTEMVTLLEARGWLNTFHNPVRAYPTVDVGGVGETVAPSSPQPGIIVENANFTIEDSPTNAGFKRITKVGGTAGTFERAARSDGSLARHWITETRDPLETANFRAGVTPTSNLAQTLSGWMPNGAGSGTFLAINNGTYSGYNRARQVGQSASVSRGPGGTGGGVRVFWGSNKIPAYGEWFAPAGSYGTTDAAVPLSAVWDIANIGGYIDVKIS